MGGSGEVAVATAREMEALRDEVADLQAAVRYLREDNRRARAPEQARLEWLSQPLRAAPTAQERRAALVKAETRDVLGELVRLASSAEVFDLGGLPAGEDRLAWRPARSTPRYHAARMAEDAAAWGAWRDSVVKKSKVLAVGSQAAEAGTGKKGRGRKKVAARMDVRLLDLDGKPVKGSGGGVQILGSREWEALQGRTMGLM